VKIEFDTASLSELELRILSILAEGGNWPPAAEPPTVVKKAAPPKPPKEAAPEPPAVEPEPVVEPAETAEDAPTMADAVAAATKLVSSGGAATVKAALAAVGSKRVSEVAPENIAAFVAALQ
jgi:hypothetical protein